MLFQACLGLGSNLGNRAANIEQGLAGLKRISDTLMASSLYETTAEGFHCQPRFLNAACAIWTSLDPFGLMTRVREIEAAVGRRRTFPNAPRELDIDILLHGRTAVRGPGLEIPHRSMAERRFVLVPLAEVAPWLRHPTLGSSVRELLAALDDEKSSVRRVGLAPQSLSSGGRKFGIISATG